MLIDKENLFFVYRLKHRLKANNKHKNSNNVISDISQKM